jgi:hypothetical protein
MRILIIGALAVLTLAILVGVLIYDRKVLAKRKLILHHLWRLASKMDDDPAVMPVRKIKLMELCKVDAIEFSNLIRKLGNEGIIHIEQDSIKFTDYGKQYYEFKVKNEYVVH